MGRPTNLWANWPTFQPTFSSKFGAFTLLSSSPSVVVFPLKLTQHRAFALSLTMVFLRQQGSSKKRQSSFTSPFPPPKVPKPTAAASAACERPLPLQQPPDGAPEASAVEKAVAILADAGCTLINPAGPPCLPSDHHKFRAHLQQTFTATSLRSDFLAGFSAHIESPENLHRLIINHFRWLDFIIDSDGFNDKLMQVLSICPLHLKKEIIGSLPEIIGDQNHKVVVDSLEQMLQEDSAIIVPVLDSLSNLHLDDELKEQVITIALSCIRTVDGEHIPYLLRFLLLSATPANSRRIISRIREQLKFIGVSNHCASQNKNKLKGKCLVGNTDASVLDTLRSGLRFKNILCQEIVKELSCLNRPQDHKVIDIWLLVLIYMNGESSKKSIENIFKKKIIDNCIQEVMIDQCIHGNANLMQDYFPTFLSITEYLLTCKEPRVRQFGIHMYTSLFEEFVDTFARQEILGALVTHVGSGVRFEVTAALETLKLLVSKYSMDLIPLSSHINGILDYLEAFSIENLQKVYEVFSQLALSANSRANSFGSSVANELMMIVRKQLNHSDVAYKRMGLIGTLKIVSCLGDTNHVGCSEQKSNIKEALELLQTSLDSSKGMVPLLILFYDEMTIMLDRRDLHSSILEWIGKHIGEFESIFLFDLEGGQLPSKDSHGGLEVFLKSCMGVSYREGKAYGVSFSILCCQLDTGTGN
ncbi:hypothetical protein CRG98_038567 [Punica granatum]|uniref:Fanconi anemia group D2 protein homolog n=1 Tax=Punica granatum TaxID=22663 RepID=A0A2I0IAL0_PUNGR|nr:hypothetical protein CRG98_038567 [Punica granatum]